MNSYVYLEQAKKDVEELLNVKYQLVEELEQQVQENKSKVVELERLCATLELEVKEYRERQRQDRAQSKRASRASSQDSSTPVDATASMLAAVSTVAASGTSGGQVQCEKSTGIQGVQLGNVGAGNAGSLSGSLTSQTLITTESGEAVTLERLLDMLEATRRKCDELEGIPRYFLSAAEISEFILLF